MYKKLSITFLFFADSGKTWTILQGRWRGNNLVAVSAVGATTATANADSRVSGEQFVVGCERHDN